MSASYRDFDWSYEHAPPVLDYVLPAVRALMPPAPARVLDVGCGNGHVAGALAALGYDVTGCDPSDSGLEMARRNFPAVRFEALLADARVLENLACDPFDAVVSTEVVEHLYAPDDWATGCFTALRDGGTMVCSTPYHGWLKNVMLACTGRMDSHLTALKVGGHIKFWSRKTLTQLLSDAGFAVTGFRGTGRLPYLWKSMVLAARRP